MAIAIITVPVSMSNDIEKTLFKTHDSFSLNNVEFYVNPEKVDEYSPFTTPGYGEMNTELLDILRSSNNRRLVYENSGFYLYDDDRKIKALFCTNKFPYAFKFNILEEFGKKINKAKVINVSFSNKIIPEFPDISYWVHILVNFEKSNVHLEILEKSASYGRRIVDMFFTDKDTFVFSIMNGLFVYVPIIYPDDPSYIAKFIDQQGRALSANIKALNQARKSNSRARLFKNTNALVNIYKNFDNTTNWYKVLFRNIFLIMFDGSQKKPNQIMEIRIAPNIARYAGEIDLGTFVQYSFKESDEYMKIKFARYVCKFTYELYTIASKAFRKKGLKPYAINTIHENRPLVCNETMVNMLNSIDFNTIGCIVSADENY